MARILAEKSESSLSPSHSFCSCTTFWRGTAGIFSICDSETMSNDPSGYVEILRRPVTPQEREWIREIVLSNPHWADAELGDLCVVAACTCRCRSSVIEAPPKPQNPKLVGHQGLVGGIDLGIHVNEKDDVISVLLHFAQGSLSLLEVVWYNFPDPVPTTWIETSRRISVGETEEGVG